METKGMKRKKEEGKEGERKKKKNERGREEKEVEGSVIKGINLQAWRSLIELD